MLIQVHVTANNIIEYDINITDERERERIKLAMNLFLISKSILIVI